ncbi:CDP-alcohol phosphatidyltransferase family protein [Microvirga sp. BT689]|uniref:CDP-alcohol phosphatidyltransferase family protein n=1 Tax=Microvirga arvi TaxID=2778731 RepID=UPI00194F6C69|nr:CDP-alcohol phosphatidyltransferase family protein [Microvirga arvi]MBM6579584.1 CDP-alcohol phosphatidyltransferase family protein [Microvirga arvi]
MLDGWMRRRIDPLLDRLGQGLARCGISADAVTLLGLGLGLIAALMIVLQLDAAALVLFGLNRLLDGLDGAVARSTRRTDRGGFLDIVLDFAIYGAIPLAFALRDPDALALPAAVLLFSFYVNGASFLAYAAVAAKRGMSSHVRGIKSIYFTAGFMEGTETILFFAAMILFPRYFPILAYAFAGLTLMSGVARVTLAWHAFRDEPEESD